MKAYGGVDVIIGIVKSKCLKESCATATYFLHLKFQTDYPGTELGVRCGKPVNAGLDYGPGGKNYKKN
jgi:hypothetical protein